MFKLFLGNYVVLEGELHSSAKLSLIKPDLSNTGSNNIFSYLGFSLHNKSLTCISLWRAHAGAV